MATYSRTQSALSGTPYRRPTLTAVILTALVTATFLAAGGYFGYLFYNAVRGMVARAELPAMPYVDLAIPALGPLNPVVSHPHNPRAAGSLQPVTGLTGDTLPDWEQAQRVNVLLLGIDKRPDESYARTDTMILVTVDPATAKAGMLSIPRDLWVTIPGYGESRINTAHYKGDQDGYPGGGPALAMKTVQYNLGVPVHFYVRIDFDGFRRIIDTLGGIDIDVPQAINDPKYPDDFYGYDPFYIEAGRQHMDGETALKYARTRATLNSDFDRAKRQQAVLLAVREKVMAIDILPKLPQLWSELGNAVQTDMQLVDIVELAKLANRMSDADIETAVIDRSMTVDYKTETGAQVLLPVREKIRPVIEKMFGANKPAAPAPTPTPDPEAAARAQAMAQEQMQEQAEVIAALQAEGARLVVQNGTSQPDLDARTAQFLRDQGFNVVQFGPGDRTDYQHTVIVYYDGKDFTLEYLADIFNVTSENIRRSQNLKSEVDIRIIVGSDFQLPEAHLLQAVGSDPFIQPLGRQ